MRNKKSNILVASAVAIMLAPAALGALPQQDVQAASGLSGLVGTIRRGAGQIVDDNGNSTNATLPNFSSWQLGQYKRMRGEMYYQVATNQWVAVTAMDIADNGQKISLNVTNYDPSLINVGTVGSNAAIMNNSGVTTGSLPVGSKWRLGQLATIKGAPAFEVGTNQWIAASSVTSMTSSDTSSQAIPTKDTNVNSETNSVMGKIGTVAIAAPVYDINGKPVSLTLEKGSQWKLGTMVRINGIPYVQVATNEYVLGAYMNYSGNTNTSTTTDTSTQTDAPYITANLNAGKTGTTTSSLAIVDNNGKSTGATLPAGQWKLGRILKADKVAYFEVGNNEWVTAAFVKINNSSTTTPATHTNTGIPTPGNGLVGRTNVAQKTYDTSTNANGQTLKANTSWKISKLVVNKYGSYWGQISTNEWVWLGNVTLNSGLHLDDYAELEPDFALNIAK